MCTLFLRVRTKIRINQQEERQCNCKRGTRSIVGCEEMKDFVFPPYDASALLPSALPCNSLCVGSDLILFTVRPSRPAVSDHACKAQVEGAFKMSYQCRKTPEELQRLTQESGGNCNHRPEITGKCSFRTLSKFKTM